MSHSHKKMNPLPFILASDYGHNTETTNAVLKERELLIKLKYITVQSVLRNLISLQNTTVYFFSLTFPFWATLLQTSSGPSPAIPRLLQGCISGFSQTVIRPIYDITDWMMTFFGEDMEKHSLWNRHICKWMVHFQSLQYPKNHMAFHTKDTCFHADFHNDHFFTLNIRCGRGGQDTEDIGHCRRHWNLYFIMSSLASVLVTS